MLLALRMTQNVEDRYLPDLQRSDVVHRQTYNDLRFNTLKYDPLSMTRSSSPTSLGTVTTNYQVKSCKDLGITLANSCMLQWSQQVAAATGRTTKLLNIIKQTGVW